MQGKSLLSNIVKGVNGRISKTFKNPYGDLNINFLKLKYLKHLPPGKIKEHKLKKGTIFFENMISVIVCSIKPGLLEQLKININKSIGVPYELLVYDNRNDRKGLCAVYNELAKKANYSILCLIHEDILFDTQAWGRILFNTLNENDIGVLGIAGSKYKSTFCSGWYTGNKDFDCANVLHRFSDHDEKIFLPASGNNVIEEVVCLDGVFIACKKEVWELVLFDEKNLKGFHFYDLDFSLRAAQNFKVAVTYQIDIAHITFGGDFGDNWIMTAMIYHHKNQHLLPVTKLKKASKQNEVNIAKTTLDVLKKQKISWRNKMKWIKVQKLQNHPSLYYSMLKFLLYSPLKLNLVHKLFK